MAAPTGLVLLFLAALFMTLAAPTALRWVFDKCSFASVKGASHEVPTYQPHIAYEMSTRFLEAQPTAPGCYVKTPSGCPKIQQYNAATWTRDDWGEKHKGAADCNVCKDQRKKAYDSWCGATDTDMFCIPQADNPTAPGCYVKTPTGCPKIQQYNAATWTRDDWGEKHKGAADCNVCEDQRKKAYDSWCGATDTDMFCIPQADNPTPPVCSSFTCPDGHTLTANPHTITGNDVATCCVHGTCGMRSRYIPTSMCSTVYSRCLADQQNSWGKNGCTIYYQGWPKGHTTCDGCSYALFPATCCDHQQCDSFCGMMYRHHLQATKECKDGCQYMHQNAGSKCCQV